MATLVSNLIGAQNVYKPFPAGNVGFREASLTITSALALNDVLQMIPVFEGECVLGFQALVPDLDSNGSPAIVLDIGDGLDVDRYVDGSTVGQAGGLVEYGSGILVADFAGTFHRYTAADTLDILVAVAPATGVASGTIRMRALIGA